MSRVIPNFFIVGAQKSGTSTLVDLLRLHPDVFMSPIKEPCHFARDFVNDEFAVWYRKNVFDPDRFVQSKHWPGTRPVTAYVDKDETYYALFRDWAGQKAIGAASPVYLWSKVAATEIARVAPGAKIIIILRNPIDRAYSEYLHAMRRGGMYDSFAEALRKEQERLARGEYSLREHYIYAGLYAEQVERYLKTFGPDQVLILRFEELAKDQSGLLQHVCRHIGVRYDPAIFSSYVHSNEGVGGSRMPSWLNEYFFKSGWKNVVRATMPQGLQRLVRKLYYRGAPPFAPEDRDYLRAIFAPDVVRLQEVTGMDFSDWLKN